MRVPRSPAPAACAGPRGPEGGTRKRAWPRGCPPGSGDQPRTRAMEGPGEPRLDAKAEVSPGAGGAGASGLPEQERSFSKLCLSVPLQVTHQVSEWQPRPAPAGAGPGPPSAWGTRPPSAFLCPPKAGSCAREPVAFAPPSRIISSTLHLQWSRCHRGSRPPRAAAEGDRVLFWMRRRLLETRHIAF